MAVDDTDKVDIMSVDGDGSLVLTISDHLGWDEATTDHLFFLQEKLNLYLRFIESGEVYEAHHDARGRSIVISIVLKHTPPHEASALLDECREVIEAAGIGFRCSVFEGK